MGVGVGRRNMCLSLNKKEKRRKPAWESMPRLRPHVGFISTSKGQLVTALAK